ncbi:hypothetical protein D3C71_77230 [compost metagenome]
MAKNKKVSEKDFELLLDELEDVIVQRGKPGASTMHAALHRVRSALLNAAKLGVSGDVPEAISDLDYRQAVALALCTAGFSADNPQRMKQMSGLYTSAFPGTGEATPTHLNPKAEIYKGMKAAAPFGMVVPMASEYEQALAKVRLKYPNLEIDVVRAKTEAFTEEKVEKLVHELRLAGEEVYKTRPTQR